MPTSKNTPLINNFTAGELSPRVDARSDVSRYANGCLKLENMIPLAAGSASRRSGTYFVAEVKDSTKQVRLISFDFSTTQSYILEFGNKYIRVYKDGGQIVVAYSAWQTSESMLVGYLRTNGGEYYRCVTAHTSGTFATDLAAGKWEVTGGASDLAYEIATPYLEADLFQLKVCQSADIMYIDHPSYPPKELTRTAHTTWTLTNHASGKFSGAGNYPSANAFFEQRLFHFATNNNPQTIYGSVSGDFDDFTTVGSPIVDSDRIEYTIASGKVDRIRWGIATDCLVLGTTGSVWKFGATTTQEALTPTNVSAKIQASFGAKDLDAEQVGESIMYVQRGGRTLRSVNYSFEQDSLIADDITIAAEHITKGSDFTTSGIVEMDYQQNPFSILWSIRADGQLIGLLWEPSQKVAAFFRYVTDGDYESVAVLSNDSVEDEVWVAVERSINGTTKRYIEYFMPYEFWGELEDYFGVDCGLTYDSTPATTISGLDHLAGETVAVLADGATHPNCVVSAGGQITLNREASKVHIGLPFTNVLSPMKIEGTSTFGTTRGKKKRVSKATISFYETYYAKWGPDEDNLSTIPFGTGGAPAVFTGDIEYTFDADISTEATIYIVGDLPLPMTVQAIVPEMMTNEG